MAESLIGIPYEACPICKGNGEVTYQNGSAFIGERWEEGLLVSHKCGTCCGNGMVDSAFERRWEKLRKVIEPAIERRRAKRKVTKGKKK